MRVTCLRAARKLKYIALATLIFSFTVLAFGQGAAPASRQIVMPSHHDISPPLRDIPSVEPFRANHEHPVKKLPAVAAGGADAALQTVPNAVAPLAPTNGFDGLGIGGGYTPNAAPPDTNGSVGSTQYVQWVNEAFAVYDKATGARILGPVNGNTLWSGFGGGCQTNNDGDPIVLWDKIDQRWVMTQFSVSTSPFLQCIAVSQTADATGSWFRYSYSFGTGFNDYPKFGVWPDAFYATYNIFANGQTFAGSKLCAYDKSKMITGAAAATVCFQLSSSFGGVLPADLDGATQPAAGTPEWFVNFGTNRLNFWRMHVDWVNTANSTLTGPTAVTVASFSPACSGGTCIVQPGTNQRLDSLADRLMYRLAYRIIGGTAHMIVNHAVSVSTGRRTTTSGVRWYDINATSATPTIIQQGTYSPTTDYRWMGSAAMDKVGNILVAYSKSSSSVFPSIFYAVHQPTDAAGTLSAETSILAGTGAQQRSLSRWGDYSSVSVDPVDDCTLWFTTEYLKANGTFNWSTFVKPIKIATCQ